MSRFESDDTDPIGRPPLHAGSRTERGGFDADRTEPEGSRGGPDDDEVVDAQPAQGPAPRKRLVVPLVAFAVAFLGALGAVGYAMSGLMGGTAAPSAQDIHGAPAPVLEQPPAAAPVAAVVSTPGSSSPMDVAAGTQNAARLQMSPQAQAADQTSAAAVMQQPAPNGAADPQVVLALQSSIERLDARIEQLSREVAQIREPRARAPSVAQASASSKPRKAPPAHQAAPPEQLPASQDAPATTETIASMSLRAVFPPTGADMQAWVMDGQTLRVVSKGSQLGGGRVLEVRPDRVLTDRGVIR